MWGVLVEICIGAWCMKCCVSGRLCVCSVRFYIKWIRWGWGGIIVYVVAGAVDRVFCRVIEYVVAGAVVFGPRSGVHCEAAAYHVQAAA